MAPSCCFSPRCWDVLWSSRMSAASSFWTSLSDTSAFTMDPFLLLTRSKGGGGGRVWGRLTLGLFRSHCWQLIDCAWDWESVPPLHHLPLPGILAPPSAMPRMVAQAPSFPFCSSGTGVGKWRAWSWAASTMHPGSRGGGRWGQMALPRV